MRLRLARRLTATALPILVLALTASGCSTYPKTDGDVARAWVTGVVQGDLKAAQRLTEGPLTQAQMAVERQRLAGFSRTADVVDIEVRTLDGSTVGVERVTVRVGQSNRSFEPDGYLLVLNSSRSPQVIGRYSGIEAKGLFFTPGVQER